MTKKLLYTAFILLIFSNLLEAQVNSSYRSKMKTTYSDPNASIPALLDSSDVYLDKDSEKSFQFLEQAYLLSLKPGNTHHQSLVLQKLGAFYEHYNQHDLAAMNYEKSLWPPEVKMDLATATANEKYLFKAGEQYVISGNAKKAILLYSKYIGRRDSPQKFNLLMATGDAYYSLEKYNRALDYYKQAEVMSQKLNLKEEQAQITIKIAKVYVATNDKRAINKLEEVKVQSAKTNNSTNSIAAESEMAEYYNNNNMYEQEIESRNELIQSLDSIESSGNVSRTEKQDIKQQKCQEQIKIAQSYNEQEFYDSTINLLDNSSFNGSDIEDDISNLELKKEATKTLSEAYLKSGQKEKALKSYEEYVQILDELYKKKELAYTNINEINKRLLENQGRINFLQKDKELYDAEIELMAQERKNQADNIRFQGWSIAFLIVVIGLLVFVVVVLNKRSKLQQKHNMMLDLKALRTQMNPHFIFNALNSVNNFIAKNDELNANKYLVRFSKLMRSILENSDSDFIPLSKEIEVLELYLQLENMRFPDKFSFEFKVDENINIKEFEIPPMLIQPHIENAIWHGLRYKERDGKLDVSLKQDGDFLKITVEDNGIGRTKSKELKTDNQKASKSRGIKNTEKRMEILSKIYKQEIRIQISDVEENGEGTLVEIWIPKLV